MANRDLGIDMCGVRFPNPFLLSSSPVSNTAEMVARAFEAGFGGAVFKTVHTGRTKIIHPAPRMAGYDYENKKLVGLQNVEQISDRTFEDNLADIGYLKKHYPDHPVIVSIMGFSEEEWGELARGVEESGADMLELNFSCPHMTVEGSGMKVGQAFELLETFTRIVRDNTSLPIIAKMTPNITDITEPALYAKKGGANGISAINTVSAISGIDPVTLVPYPNVSGKSAMSGYSGPAVKPIGLRCITQLAQCRELGLPLSGLGGVETWIDALEYILCGASTVQMTTGVIHYGYRIVEDMIEGLSDFMDEREIENVSELVGKALPNIHPTDAFDLGRQGVARYDLERCVGCGQCYIICHDAGGQSLKWDAERRRPVPDDDTCVSCMICSFVCPVANPPMISYEHVPGKREIVPPVSR